MTRISLVGVAVGAAICLTTAVGWAADEPFAPEPDFFPRNHEGPPSEEHLREMLEAGYITQRGFNKATEQLRMFHQYGDQPHDGPGMGVGMHGGPMGVGEMEPGRHDVPPTKAELQAARDAGHLTPQEYKSHLRDLEAWHRGDAATRREIMKKHEAHPAPFEAGGQPAQVIRTQTQSPNVNIRTIREIRAVPKGSNPPHHP